MNINFPNIKLYFYNLPKSFSVFGYEITIYGIILAAALMLGTAVIVLEAKRRHQSSNKYLGMIICALFGGVLGSRLYYVLQHIDYYKEHTEDIYHVTGGGFALYGGIAIAILVVGLYCLCARIRFGEALDTLTPGLLIGQAVAVWGNFFNREALGEYTDSILAMQIPLSDVRPQEVTAIMQKNLAVVDNVSYIQAHPMFLYESIWCLILVLVLLGISRRKRFHGELFLKYLVGYSFARGIMEWFRADKVTLLGTPISLTMIVSFFTFIIAMIVLSVCSTMAKKRARARKERKEKIYQEEERAEKAAQLREWENDTQRVVADDEKTPQTNAPESESAEIEAVQSEDNQSKENEIL